MDDVHVKCMPKKVQTGDTPRSLSAEVFGLVEGYFGDRGKTEMWMKTPNPLLGGQKPKDMIRSGDGERLVRIVKEMLD